MIKKALSVALVVLLCSSGLTAAAATPFFQGEVEGVVFAANSNPKGPMMKENGVLNPAGYPLLTELLNNAKPSPKLTDPLDITGEFTVTTGSETISYQVGTLANGGNVYLNRMTSDVTYLIDGKAWNKFTNTLGNDVYTYSSLPTLSLPNGEAKTILGITSSTYSYRKLNGLYYQIDPSAKTKVVPTISSAQLANLKLDTKQIPTTLTTKITQGNKEVWTGDFNKLSTFKPTSSGDYTLTVVAAYDDGYFYKGTVTSQAIIKHGESKSTGSPSFTLTGSSTFPGEVVVIRANNIPSSEPVKVVTGIDFTPNFFDDGKGGQIALFPVSYRHNVGTYNLTLSAMGMTESFTITLNDKTFQVQQLQASAENAAATLLNDQANAEFETYIAPIRPIAHNTAYWAGTDFIWPTSTNKITTQFGMKRFVNGAATTYRHGAIDFAVPLGTPVGATNNGKVLYAGFLKLTGNTVVIEHGFGLKSWYYHMNSLDVATGDTVTVGQKIGEVGSTGFSTGPHLHFGMSVNNVFINPSTVVNDKRLKLN